MTETANLRIVCIDKYLSTKELIDRTQVIVDRNRFWNPGKTLRICFLNGDPKIQEKVRIYASKWMEVANIKFEFVSGGDTEIRIGFGWNKDYSSWSYIGTDSLLVPLNRPTMNLSLTADTSDEECKRIVLHQFGHALGCIHEHQVPANAIPWNKEAVYRELAGPPNNWSKEDVDHNVFEHYSKTISQYTEFDPDSIMLYPIPARWTTNYQAIGGDSFDLSNRDKEFIRSIYPDYEITSNSKRDEIHIEGSRDDVFGNVTNANIINKSTIQNAFNKVKSEHDEETSKALIKIAEFIEKSNEPAAGALFNSLTDELNKPQPDKSKLKSFWSGIQNVLPSIVSISASPIGNPPHKKIDRFPYARFPDKVILEEVIPLEVIIKAVQSLSPDKTETTITLTVPTDRTEIPVTVIVESSGFEIFDKYYATITVPIKPEDSKAVIFNLQAKKEGSQNIEIRFYQQETFVGEIEIEAFVTGSGDELHSQTAKGWKSLDKLPDKIIQGPDITLYIHEKRTSPDFEYDVLVTSREIPIKEIGSINFPFNPETKFNKIFEDIENLNLQPNIIDRKIKAKGISLYDELFPPSLKDLYWEKRNKIKSIRIISKEPWIPWEIIKPWHRLDNGDIEEDEFLCERYAFSRWIVDKSETIKEQISKVKVIVPLDTNLTSAVKERDWIRQFAMSKGLEVSFDSTYEQVLNSLETGGIDVLHFSTHGERNKDSPLLSAVELEGRVQLRTEDISGRAMKFGNSSPFVILNACQTGSQGFSLTGIQGWAIKFLGAGASVFIGTLWSVSDETALRFVQDLYTELSIGTTLGEAVRKSRNKCKQSGDPSWLAYQLYGHPNVTFNFGYVMTTQNA